MTIRLVTFDALYTLIKPRRPIHVQYAEVFERHVRAVDADKVKRSFQQALRDVERERPAYRRGGVRDAEGWWGEVIWRTGVGAGLDARGEGFRLNGGQWIEWIVEALDRSLGEIVTTLMRRFSSKEGYEAYDDAISTVEELRKRGVYVGVITNADGRMREVLRDLEFPEELWKDLVVVSEEEGVEKPDARIFGAALGRVNGRYGEVVRAEESMHVGDELESDYEGAVGAGWRGVLVGRDVGRLGEVVEYVG